jgi:hypothetical protein
VLSQRIELVCECRLQFFTGDIGQLRFGDEGLGFSSDELLLQNYYLWRVRLLIFQLRDLIGDFLLP